jgi:osmotically-inducible protein OsmY
VTARAAARAAERVKEVTAVVQDLEVNTRGGEESTDDGLATRALSALAADPAIPDDRLSLTIEDGWITVAGEVDWEYQKVAAADDIHRVAGIRGVTNDIVITVHDVVGG